MLPELHVEAIHALIV
jgi:Ser/Thr protein kinase RdoA (MazF antagonist)